MTLLNQEMSYESFQKAFKGISSGCIGKETGYSRKTVEKWRRDKKDFTGTTAIILNALKSVLEKEVTVTRTGKEWILAK